MNLQDVCIVGGGAAGVSAALFLSQNGFRGSVVLLEKKQKLLTKFEYTANGRGNLTNKRIDASCYVSSAASSYVQRVLALFPSAAAIDWLTSFGFSLVCDEQRGRLYPEQQSARVVASAFASALQRTSCQVRLGVGVLSWEYDSAARVYTVSCDDGSVVHARRIIWATGGAAAPVFGTDGSWVSQFAQHEVASAPWCPVLCGLRLQAPVTQLSGSVVRCRFRLISTQDDTVLFDQEGDLLWTHFGVSGPVVFDASVRVGSRVSECVAVVQLVSPEWFETLWGNPGKKCVSDVFGDCPPKVRQYFQTLFANEWDRRLSSAGTAVKNRLVASFVTASFRVIGLRDANDAQTSRGGIALSEIVVKTGSLKKYP